MITNIKIDNSSKTTTAKFDDRLIQANFRKLFLYSFFQCFMTFVPVSVPYFQGLGLSVRDVFLLQGIFGATLIALDIPAGYLADLLGRKRALLIGSLVSAAGWQILWFGKTFWHFAAFEIVLGVGLSLQSGCDIGILYNSMETQKTFRRKAEVLGRRMMALTLGEGIGALLSVLLVQHSLAWAAYANCLIALIPPFLIWTVHEPEGHKLARSGHLQNIKEIWQALFGQSSLLRLVILNHVFYGFATYCAVWTLQPFWTSKGVAVAWFGVLWAVQSFLIAGVSRTAHFFEERFGSYLAVITIGVTPIIGYLGMAWTPGIWALGFAIFFPVCRGLSQVIFPDAINTRVPPKMRATANSIGSLGMRSLFIVVGPLLGATIDRSGPAAVLQELGWFYVLVFVGLAVPLLTKRREFRLS